MRVSGILSVARGESGHVRGFWRLKRLLARLGYDERNWLRVRQIEAFEAFLRGRAETATALEISPGWNSHWRKLPWRSYASVEYPDFDICRDVTGERYDVVIADQVLEHVARPVQAAANIRQMLRPGGVALVAMPFLFRVHARPHDYTRWTPAGLRQGLVDAGFSAERIHVEAWGNRACARAHLGGEVKPYGFWRDMRNEDEYPLMVWAFAEP